MYTFHSLAHGPCRMEARMSGKHGFGAPKTFIISSLDPAMRGAYTLRYRDMADSLSPTSALVRNFDLIMAAIAQFCVDCPSLSAHLDADLTLGVTPFAGEVNNRYGRVVSANSFLPRREATGKMSEAL